MSTDTRQWYVKWRPYRLEDYEGDSIKSKIIRRFTSKEKRPNVIMTCGTRGCGKTTIDRIIPKYYLCLNPKEDGSPCEECEMCQTINERLIYGEAGVACEGVVEVDATRAGGKEFMENLIEEALIAPIFGDKKVIIFDECHKLTSAAQSLLLKVLEDIPKHLVVILATTDEDKVLQPIRSRCQVTIEVKKQSIDSMVRLLMKVAKGEGLTVSEEALRLIARYRDRVPRECINTLEDVAKSFDGEVTVEHVNELCNLVSSEIYIKFFEAANDSLESILMFIRELKTQDFDINQFVSGLMKFTMEAMYIRHGIGLDDYTKEYIKSVGKLFKMYTTNEFDMLLQVMENTMKNITEDNNKNDVILTTSAMRVGKIALLADGLGMEIGRAVVENNKSMAEYMKSVEASKIVDVEEDFNVKLSTQEIIEEYNGASEVKGVADMLKIAAMELHMNSSDEETAEDSETVVEDDVERFFGV